MSGIRTFMVELANEHTVTRRDRSYCSVSRCRRRHETTETGTRRHIRPDAFTETVYDVRRIDTGEVIAHDVWAIGFVGIAGAMYWQGVSSKGADERRPGNPIFASGPQLEVILPDLTPWNIDGRANNCTMPDDFDHRCWVRHGEPPAITVDKNGVTCAAGAGSIQTGAWHGFLTNGELVP